MARILLGDQNARGLYQAGDEVRTRRSGRHALILSSWDNGSQMLYLIQFPDADGEPPRWVSEDMLRDK